MGYYVGPWMFLPALFSLLVIAGIAALVVAIVRRPPFGPGPAAEDPLRTLSVRYARGEVEREQYLRMRDDIEGRGRQP